MAKCARCGRAINTGSGDFWTPTAPGELCSWCLTGHAPDWIEEGTEPTPTGMIVFAAVAVLLMGVGLSWLVYSSTGDTGGMAFMLVASPVEAVALVLIFRARNRRLNKISGQRHT